MMSYFNNKMVLTSATVPPCSNIQAQCKGCHINNLGGFTGARSLCQQVLQPQFVNRFTGTREPIREAVHSPA